MKKMSTLKYCPGHILAPERRDLQNSCVPENEEEDGEGRVRG